MRKTAKHHKPTIRRFTARAKQKMVAQIHPGLDKSVAIADFLKLRDTISCENIADVRPRNRFGSNFVDFFTMTRRLAWARKAFPSTIFGRANRNTKRNDTSKTSWNRIGREAPTKVKSRYSGECSTSISAQSIYSNR